MKNTEILHNVMFDIQRWRTSDALRVMPFETANFYLRLLIFCAETGEISADPKDLAIELRASAEDIERLLPEVLPWFKAHQRTVGFGERKRTLTFLTHHVVDEVREKSLTKINKNRENGTKGGRPKKNNEKQETQRLAEEKPDGLTIGIENQNPMGKPEEKRKEEKGIEENLSGERPGPVLVERPEEAPCDSASGTFEEWYFDWCKCTGKPVTPAMRMEAKEYWLNSMTVASRQRAHRFNRTYAEQVKHREKHFIKSPLWYLKSAEWEAVSFALDPPPRIYPQMGMDKTRLSEDPSAEYFAMQRRISAEKKGA